MWQRVLQACTVGTNDSVAMLLINAGLLVGMCLTVH